MTQNSPVKVTLVSPYINITSLGVRYLSSFLRQAGFQTRLVFLPDLKTMASTGVDFRNTYSERTVKELAELVSDSDLLGFTLMTNYYFKVADLTDRLRKYTSIPIAWGGPHPTSSPEECLEHADIVCIGEGEDALIEVMKRIHENQALENIPNIWVRGAESHPEMRAPLEDLDSLPFPDYSLEDHYVLLGDSLVKMDDKLLRLFCVTASNFDEADEVIYETIASRGCPHRCSFCMNYKFRELYKGHRFFRRRSMKNLVDELVSIRQRFPWFNRIVFQDDCFTATTTEDLNRFEEMYSSRVACPFFFLLSSNAMDEERIKPMLKAGLHKAQVGVQSASSKTNSLYDRDHFSPELLLERAIKLQELSGNTTIIAYDIMLDNPFEDVGSMLETLNLTLALPAPRSLQLFSLTLFPGTMLWQMAIDKGIIDNSRAHYLKEDHEHEFRYMNLLFAMVNRGTSDRLVKALSWKPLVYFMESAPMRRLFDLFSPLYNNHRRIQIRAAFNQRFFELLKMMDQKTLEQD